MLSWILLNGVLALPQTDPQPGPLFLKPEQFTVPASTSFKVSLERGARQVRLKKGDVAHLFLRGGGDQLNLESPNPGPEEGEFAVAFEKETVLLMGVDLKPEIRLISRAELQRMAKRMSPSPELNLTVPDSAMPGSRLLVTSAANSLVVVGDPVGVSAVALSKTGQSAQIRLLADPTTLRPGDDLPFRAYVDGSGAGGIPVRAVTSRRDGVLRATTDPSGHGRFKLTGGGSWRIYFSRLARLGNRDEAQWHLAHASISFELGDREGNR